MRVTLAGLADAATLSSDGKLNVLGIFDVIWAEKFPAAHPHCAYFARFEAENAELGNNATKAVAIQLRVVDEDGGLAAPVAQMRGVLGRAPEGEMITAPLVLDITSATFKDPGTFTFELAIDGEVLGRTYLYVRKRPDAVK
ncbi:MAG: DUF6941 family protein [Gemmatimonadales bacterium]